MKQNEHIISLLVSPRGCAVLIDAAGHVHEVPLKYCMSFQVSFV